VTTSRLPIKVTFNLPTDYLNDAVPGETLEAIENGPNGVLSQGHAPKCPVKENGPNGVLGQGYAPKCLVKENGPNGVLGQGYSLQFLVRICLQ
jgi:hypothetical protein